MAAALKLLLHLWCINLAPPLLAHFLENSWNTPVDGNRRLADGRPLFGPHKTRRGVIAGIAVGVGLAPVLDMPLWLGATAGIASMVGDLLSSFIKRRLDLPSGSNVPGLDQVFEGALPFAFYAPYYAFGAVYSTFLLAFFSVGAYAGSYFLKNILRREPFAGYPRPLRSAVRLRELRKCQIRSHPWHHVLNLKEVLYHHLFMTSVFKVSGIYDLGRRNALDLQMRSMDWHFPDLPPAFDGYSILFMTDLHLDGMEELTDKLLGLVRELHVNLCLLGGDFRMEEYGCYGQSLLYLKRLIPEIHVDDGIFSVLGNHDCLEMIEPLEETGIRVLLNEARPIERDGQRLWIVGVDDPHYYACHDPRQAFNAVAGDEFTIFLAHSPEVYQEASRYGARLYLCGHTHAGQIQLPGIGLVSTHTRGPRFICEGHWNYQGMQGYTSSGVGVSGVPLRFLSRGEVVRMVLRRGPSRFGCHPSLNSSRGGS